MVFKKQQNRNRRHERIRGKIFGTKEMPRLCVFRSAKHIYAQIIDDEKRKTLVAASDLELKLKSIKVNGKITKPGPVLNKEKNEKEGKVAIAFGVGQLIAEKALKKKIEKVVFDRGGYNYHGRIKALAEGARKGGLKF